jgi:acyl transferase domain-containing protein/NAD(P)H-dependent flavin oxidoreductase YrpB (nitropropane dioxygenase family)/NAD(P)-dependent dehydrogenase (short-subunit alcohol dehydrogenase family)
MMAGLTRNGSESFTVAASTITGWPDAGIAIAASRSGAVGILNLLACDLTAARRALDRLARYGKGALAVKLAPDEAELSNHILRDLPAAVDLAIATAADAQTLEAFVSAVRAIGRRVWLECTSIEDADVGRACGVDGLIAKGHEAGGFVGEETTFILLQRLLARSDLPVWASGGIGLQTAPACLVAGAAGVVLESQLLLTPESGLPESVRRTVESMDGSETICVGSEVGEAVRVYRSLGAPIIDELQGQEARRPTPADWRATIRARAGWGDPMSHLWLLGQEAAFAAPLVRRHKNVAGIVRAIHASCKAHVAAAKQARAGADGAPLARAHGTRYPIVQGPMTRVSDTPAFAEAVADGGGLPFLALALMRGPQVRALLEETQARLGARPWGIGILGFVPPDLRQEQLDVVRDFHPPVALIAGGRPDQAAALEARGVATYLHVPAPALLGLFLDEGARRFVFEGRECGGHVGPRSSFVLWSSMVEVLLDAIGRGVPAEELHVLFAGGIHDARSAAMVQAIAAPLAAAGVRIGMLMGTAYLFTEEAVRSGAILRDFQEQAIACTRTVLLETGPGHSTRCADTPFCDVFHSTKQDLIAQGRPVGEIRDELESLNVGRLRIASKGITRATDGTNGEPRYAEVSAAQQHCSGMYMLGQLAALRDRVCTIAELHEDVSLGSARLLDQVSVAATAQERPFVNTACDVAIVGIGCLLPRAADASTFWHNILSKVDAITEVPKERFDVDRYFDPDRHRPDKIYSRWGGFLDDVTFDPVRYGIPPNALSSIDPVQLLTLEVVHQALQDAGYLDREFARERASVILGAGGGLGDLGLQYGFRATLPMMDVDGSSSDVLEQLPQWTEDSFPGILLNVIAGRVANRFDLGGANFTVDAACASSLAAVYLATRELSSGSSDLVIAGGVDTVQSPFGYLCFSKTQALSPRGRCRAFDATADGIAISEGLAVVVLKRLADAERDGDRIYAVIKGVAASSDGRDKSLTSPRPQGQMRVLQRAYAEAGFSPSTVGLIEAHGTGTVVGDAAEVASLTEVFRQAGARGGTCALGSVKSMIGHTKSTAGVAGLIKVALALHHKVLPPTLHVERPNPKLEEPDSPFFLNTDPTPWISRPDGMPRRAGISAFGFGGTNAHAVLEEYGDDFRDRAAHVADPIWPAELFFWRAESPAALEATLGTLEQSLGRGARQSLRGLAAAICLASSSSSGLAGRPVRRSAEHEGGSDDAAKAGVRLAIVASSLEDLRAKLAQARELLTGSRSAAPPAAPLPHRRGIYLSTEADPPVKIAFLFPGQGSQRPNMLRDLAVRFGDLRESVERADRLLSDRFPRPLSTYIYPAPAWDDEARERQRAAITGTHVAQPALAAVEVGAVGLLARLGIRPDMTAGHSYGEYVALWAAGALDESALFQISETRGRVIKESLGADAGTMAAVHAPADRVVEALAEKRAGPFGTDADEKGACPLFRGVWLANLNSPRQTVIAGEATAIEDAMRRLTQAGLKSQQIPVACAFHSPLMEASQVRLAAALSALTWQRPRVPVYSNSLGAVYPDDPGQVAELLARHLIRPVRFVDEIAAIYDAGARLFLEVGPGTTLSGLARHILDQRNAVVLSIDGSGPDGVVPLLHAVGQLAANGVPVDFDALFRDRVSERVDPTRLARSADGVRRASALWLVNGGRARPAGTKQVATDRGKETPVMAKPHPSTPEPRTSNLEPPTSNLEPRTSNLVPNHSAPRGGEEEVLAQFQQVMRQFLDTQATVMTAFLQGRPAEAVQDEHWPSAAPGVAAPGVGRPRRGDLSGDFRAADDAYRPSDPVAASSQPEPAERTSAPVAAEPSAVPAGGEADHVESVGARLLQIVSDRTGYPVEMLDLDLDIEADLGIDSIKRVEILSAFQRQSTPAAQTRVQALMDRLARMKTLRELTQELSGSGDDEPEPPGPGRETPRQRAATDEGSTPREAERVGDERAVFASSNLLAPAKAAPHEGRAATTGRGEANLLAPAKAAPHEGRAATTGRGEANLPRLTLVSCDAPLVGPASSLSPGRVSVITDDERGVAHQIAAELEARGERPVVLRRGAGDAADRPGLYETDVTDPECVARALDRIRRDHGPIGGILHLLPLVPCEPVEELSLEAWRTRVRQDITSLYAVVRAARPDLERRGSAGGAFLVAVTSMGGALGTKSSPSIIPTHAGVVATIRTLALELPVRCKAIDLDSREAVAVLGRRVFDEIASDDVTLAVGYESGRRVTVAPAPAPLDSSDASAAPCIDSNGVVLLTGGARGITAEVAYALARRYRPTLVLVGRAPEPFGNEPIETASIEDPQRLKAALAASLSAGDPNVRPGDVQRAWRELLGRREIARNLARLRDAGSRVVYRQVDVRDEAALGGVIDEIYRQYGRLDLVVHGAGVIEDRLIGDKTPDSFDRVVHTKADSVFLLSRLLRPEGLRALALMSSVTATFGNRGQFDYAAANGILNGFAARLSQRWPARVVALNWGPWAGAGMASPEVQAQFRQRGVEPIEVEEGANATIQELSNRNRTDAIVAFGAGPWLQQAPGVRSQESARRQRSALEKSA